MDSAVQTDIQVQKDEKVEEARVQAKVEAAAVGTCAFFCNSIFWNNNINSGRDFPHSTLYLGLEYDF